MCVCLQSTVVVDLPGGVAELDSDMADITQSFPTESMLGGEEDSDQLLAGEMDVASGKLGGLTYAELNGVSASSHMASSLGINPHTLQVELQSSQTQTHGTSGLLNLHCHFLS